MTSTRKLRAIFYADVAGYSRLTGSDEMGTHRAVVGLLDFTQHTIQDRGGSVVRYAGDAILAGTLKNISRPVKICCWPRGDARRLVRKPRRRGLPVELIGGIMAALRRAGLEVDSANDGGYATKVWGQSKNYSAE